LLGSEGLLSAGNVIENTVVKSTKDGVTAAKPEFFFLERYMRAYAAEWSAFVNAIDGKSPIPVTLDDGINALMLAEAATRSAKTGQAVKLSDLT
jgi:myo-inositol 2-dehydrogenase/D-chiro-inositol 1-dehydrogenase